MRLARPLPGGAGPARRAPFASLVPGLISTGVLVACLAAGALMAYDAATGVALIAALCYAPVVLLNLPLGIALWLPTTFLTSLPGVDLASQAAGLLIAVAWLGNLRARSYAGSAVARGTQWVLAVFIVWLATSVIWSEQPDAALTALQPWVASALLFVVLMTTDLDRRQTRMIAGAYVVGVVASVALGLIGGLGPATGLSAITEQDGRLQGGVGDPNYLAAGIVPAIAIGAGLAAGVRGAAGRMVLALSAGLLVIGLAATQSRGGLLAALMATAVALVVAKHGRAFVIAFIAIVVGVGALWFAASPDAWERVTDTADSGNGRGSLWRVAGRIFSDHPLVGVGLDNYQVHAPRYVNEPGALEFVNFIAERPHVVHNVYLQLIVETGMIGLALFLVVVLRSLAAAVSAARAFELRGDLELAALARGLLVAVVAGLTASFFISNGPGFQLWVLLAFGPLLLRQARQATAGAGELSPRGPDPRA